jgi:hypothetical protein
MERRSSGLAGVLGTLEGAGAENFVEWVRKKTLSRYRVSRCVGDYSPSIALAVAA